MTLPRLPLLPALLASTFLLASGCEYCEGNECDDTPAPLEEGTWQLRFPTAPTMSTGCERLGMEVESLDPIYVQLATPSDTSFVMDLDGVIIRGERFADSLVGEGSIDAQGGSPAHPEEVPDRETDGDEGGDSGCDTDGGGADDKCETTSPPEDRAANSVALDAVVRSPTDIQGELIVHLELDGTTCEASFGFRGTHTSDGGPDEPVEFGEDDDAPPPVAVDA